jgi:predicted ATPase
VDGGGASCKGELVLTNAEAQREAERHYLRSIDISGRQGALSWELRSATSLVRRWHESGRTQEASALLAEVYGRFTEGFETLDLIKARMLIGTLKRSC